MSLNAPTEKPGTNPSRLPLCKDLQMQGKSIQVTDEQDLGATILYSRYLTELKAIGAEVIFEVCPELYNLFRNWPLLDKVVMGSKTKASRSSVGNTITLASLPEKFQESSDALPDNAPYLFADPEKINYWSEKITGPGLNVGLFWEAPAYDCSLSQLSLLFDIDGLQCYNLQKDFKLNEFIDSNSKPLINLGDEFTDLSDTAAAIANLDLVIGIDSPVSHLAGAMGKPVWVMLPHASNPPWFPENKKTSWYPSMTLYRQPGFGNWKTPLAEIKDALVQLKSKRLDHFAEETVNQLFATALSCHQQGAVDSAEAGYLELLSLAADHYQALAGLGLLYLNSQRYNAAVHTLRRAVELNPADHLCLNNLGFAFQRLGKMASALALYAGAIVCKPDYITAYQNIGNVFLDLNNMGAVIHWYSKALEINPDNANTQLEMGKLYLNQLDISDAREHFENAVLLEPQNVNARISLATTALMQGDFPVGWDQYRWRFKDKNIAGSTYPAKFNMPKWQGEPFKNKRLLIHCEQGLGDTIQFSRLISKAKALGGEILFQVQEALQPLFQHLSGVDALEPLPAEQPEVPDADLYCPLMDLPYCLGISSADVGMKKPYIIADSEKVGLWRKRIDPSYFSIGIVWEGNLDNSNGRNRACTLSTLLELEKINGIRFYSLQKEVSETDSKLLKSHPNVIQLGVDFVNTAAAIACLDLVISVDTAVAHLAGAMGKPVWLMLPYVPDWRWMLHRTDTPWYPTMRLFRQPFENGWAPLVQSIKHDLKAHLNGHSNELLKTAQSYVADNQWLMASHIYARLSALLPHEPDVHHLHGLVLKELHEYESALQKIDRAIALRSDKTTYRCSRGDLLEAMGDLDAAQETYHQILAVDPSDHHAMINLGNIRYRQNRPDEALKWYHSTLTLDPKNIRAINNIGKATFDLGHIESAIMWYDKALAIEPEYAEARFNRALALLSMGTFSEGWKEYEWRLKRKSAKSVYPHRIDCQRWDGSSFIGRHLLVHCEQGIGDAIQFCRYLKKVKSLGGELTVEVHQPLASLMRQMSEIDHVITFNPQQPPSGRYDFHIPMASLPFLFGTTRNTIPDRVPYIQPSPAALSRWQVDAPSGNAFNVGLVWSGSANETGRTCPLPLILELMPIPGIRFFSLQYNPDKTDLEIIDQNSNLIHWGDRLSGFNETAAAIDHLDLIISIDTSTAHLAGAMGKPVWILLPHPSDWRWLRKCEDSPWYPTARLFRQLESGDWQSVICHVKSELLNIPPITGHKREKAHQLAKALFISGTTHHHNLELDQAISCYKKVLAIAPDLVEAYRNMGLAYYQKGDLPNTAESYLQSLNLQPDSVDMLLSLGVVYAQMGRHAETEALYHDALKLDPANESVLYNLGNLYLETGKLESAAKQYRLVLEKNPEHTKALCNIGRAMHRLGDIKHALKLYSRALEINPDQPILHVNRATALLLQGNWQEGWDEYEWRLKGEKTKCVYPHTLKGRRWTGESFAGKTLLIHGEQGFGDAIQFVRFLPMVKALGGRVLLETHASLIALFSSLGNVDQFIELSDQQPPQVHYDLFFPLCSLARHFNVSPDSVPSSTPYLQAEDKKVKHWRSRLPDRGFNVGITWAGSNTYPERSCTLEDLSPLTQLSGINWIGLQKSPASAQINSNNANSGLPILNWGDDFKDFSDTAAAISNMDLVISIDTAVAHLAGALGKPVWILLPKVADWRWMLHRTDTPWYPNMRLFRQPRHADWKTVMQNMIAEMQSMKRGEEKNVAHNLHFTNFNTHHHYKGA